MPGLEPEDRTNRNSTTETDFLIELKAMFKMMIREGRFVFKSVLVVLALGTVYLLGTAYLGDFSGQVKDILSSNPAYKETVQHASQPSLPETNTWTSTQPAPPKVSDPAVKLILLTYMRSGSTFTGDLFNQHPQVFYFYEPLWSFDFHFKKGEPVHFFNRDPVPYKPKKPTQLWLLQTRTIESLLGCEFLQVNTEVLDTLKLKWNVAKSNSCRPFAKCIRNTPGTSGLLECLPLLDTACTSSRVAFTKTVRFTMEQAESLLEDDPKVKVIHLVRDPRGVLRSREVTTIGLQYHETGKQLCTTVLRDLQVSERLKKKYPGRILTARYEDLAENPLLFSRRLLNFAGLQMSPFLQTYVWSITSTGRRVHEEDDTTIRSDSKSTASHWRNITTMDFVANLDKNCLKVYDHMGYLPFANEIQLKNLSRPVYKALSQGLPWLW